MYYILQYIKHLFTATNQYGVHSPFVYIYLTKCLYVRSKYKGSKSEKVVLKSIPYFSIKKLLIDVKDLKAEHRILSKSGIKALNETPLDLIYIDNITVKSLSSYQDKIHNSSMMLIENIHNTKETSLMWQTFTKNEMVTVSIDMFYCGVLFFRNEQVKEHFKIRI